MSHDHPSHSIILANALRDLNQDASWHLDDVQLLAGGRSGSSVYAIQLAGERVVLKVTSPAARPALLAQARREAAFYQDLAPDIPLAVPRLIAASASTGRGVAILLGADEPAPVLSSWTGRHYTEIATQLGQLHGRFWGRTDRLRTFRWLRPDVLPALPVRAHHATSTWRIISEREDLAGGATPRRLRAAAGLVARLPALDPPPPLPDTLCHGDCHAENLLRDTTGAWVWADWQGVRTGQGPQDLAFFWQRAEMADGQDHRAAMVSAYRTGLESEGADAPSDRQLQQALAWAELTSSLLDWPPFLIDASAARLGVILDRIDDAAARLAIGLPE